MIFYDSYIESKVSGLIDLFDHNYEKKLGFNELFLIVAFIAAYENGQTCRFLHIFGQILFQSLSGAQDHLSLTKFATFVKIIIDKSSNEINTMLKKFDVDKLESTHIEYEDFELFLYYLCRDIDKNTKNVKLYNIEDGGSIRIADSINDHDSPNCNYSSRKKEKVLYNKNCNIF